MPRLSPATRHEQQTLLDRIGHAHETKCGRRLSNRQIAEIAGVDATMPSKWVAAGEDGREISAAAKERIADTFGWDVVYGASIRAAGLDLVERSPTAAADPLAGAIDLVGGASALLQRAHAAAADRRYDPAEREELRELALRARSAADSLLAAVEQAR